MNFKKLTEDITVKQLNEVAANWYKRLNKLKDFYANHPDHPQASRILRLIVIMNSRLLIITDFYKEMLESTPLGTFKQRGMN